MYSNHHPSFSILCTSRKFELAYTYVSTLKKSNDSSLLVGKSVYFRKYTRKHLPPIITMILYIRTEHSLWGRGRVQYHEEESYIVVDNIFRYNNKWVGQRSTILQLKQRKPLCRYVSLANSNHIEIQFFLLQYSIISYSIKKRYN
jgi:hypothetical protein